MILKNWKVVSKNKSGMLLAGEIYGSNLYKDGEYIVTSQVKKTIGRVIITASGSVYKLEGEPSKEYQEFLDFVGFVYDQDNPIKLVRNRNGKKDAIKEVKKE